MGSFALTGEENLFGVSSKYHYPLSLFISIRRSLICAANTPLLEEVGHSRSRFSKEGLAPLRQ
jgi:hypothetical protein